MFDMSFIKYGCHTSNLTHRAIKLYRHIDPTFLTMSTKIHTPATATSHIVVKYVPETNMPLKYQIYANYCMHTYKTTMLVCIPHMNSLQSGIWLEALVHIISHY